MGFGSKSFLSDVCSSFIVGVTKKIFLNRFSILSAIKIHVLDDIGLGAHTDIFVYSCRLSGTPVRSEMKPVAPGRTWCLHRLVWAHAKTQPFTVPKPFQCTSCHCLRTVGGSPRLVKRAAVVDFLCSACGRKERVEVSTALRTMDGGRPLVSMFKLPSASLSAWSAGSRGEWCYERMAAASYVPGQ